MLKTISLTKHALGLIASEIGLKDLKLIPSRDPLVPILFFRARLREALRFARLLYQYILFLRVCRGAAVYDDWYLMLSSHAPDGFALYDFPGLGGVMRSDTAYKELLRLCRGVRRLLRQQIRPVRTRVPPQPKPTPFTSLTQIDAPLHELVPLLNGLGYRTVASCSGHDRPNAEGLERYAYVTFRSPGPQTRHLLRHIDAAENIFQGVWRILCYPEAGPGLYSLQRFPECWTTRQAREAHEDIRALTALLRHINFAPKTF